MIFNVPGHIAMIRNGLFWYEGIDKADWPSKGMKEFNTHRTQFLADRSDISKEVKEGLHPLIVKTQTRRVNRGIYQVGKDYAVQRKRGVKAEEGIKIVIDRIGKARMDPVIDMHKLDLESTNPAISKADAWAEGGYTPLEFERTFQKLNPKWDGEVRWIFVFHVVEQAEEEDNEV